MNINRIYLNLRQMSSENYAIFWGGRGGGHQKITLEHRGEGGGQEGPKKDHIIFERSIQDPFVVRPFLVFFGQWCVGISSPARLV